MEKHWWTERKEFFKTTLDCLNTDNLNVPGAALISGLDPDYSKLPCPNASSDYYDLEVLGFEAQPADCMDQKFTAPSWIWVKKMRTANIAPPLFAGQRATISVAMH